MSEKKTKNNNRGQIIRLLAIEELKSEKVILTVFFFAFFYALISNFFLHCSLKSDTTAFVILASVDDIIRNCCYGAIISIAFYFLNDYYKNIKTKVDVYNDLYPELYNLWLKVYQLILALSNHKYNEEDGQNEVFDLIMHNLYKDDKKDIRLYGKSEIEIGICHLLLVLWTDINKNKKRFLEVYGNIITREEYLKLNDNEYIISMKGLTKAIPKVKHFVKGQTATLRDYDIQRTIHLILKCKSDLANMANKYSKYYYDNNRGIRKDAF